MEALAGDTVAAEVDPGAVLPGAAAGAGAGAAGRPGGAGPLGGAVPPAVGPAGGATGAAAPPAAGMPGIAATRSGAPVARSEPAGDGRAEISRLVALGAVSAVGALKIAGIARSPAPDMPTQRTAFEPSASSALRQRIADRVPQATTTAA